MRREHCQCFEGGSSPLGGATYTLCDICNVESLGSEVKSVTSGCLINSFKWVQLPPDPPTIRNIEYMRILKKTKIRADEELEDLKDFVTESHAYIDNNVSISGLIIDRFKMRVKVLRRKSNVKKRSKVLYESIMTFTKLKK